ncbi:hypothetical protein SAMN06295924_1302 [Rathayibacter rathayi NCPPB 2980 = VKM Ac-1601]|nr:hypothetical protein FB469_0660 [Rathayibacter rathayi]SOE06068.1 hypothetical protein SAMN06295924_1302 [Rathayibacter rathayi NCPPB 2980 = VKM Ac-1601]
MVGRCGASVDGSVIAAPALASSSSHEPQAPQIRALVRALSAAVMAGVIVTFALATAGCAGPNDVATSSSTASHMATPPVSVEQSATATAPAGGALVAVVTSW